MVPKQIVARVVLSPSVLLANPRTNAKIGLGPSRFGTFFVGVLVLCSQLISLPPRRVASYRKRPRWEQTGDIDVCLDEKLRLLNGKGKMTDMSVGRDVANTK